MRALRRTWKQGARPCVSTGRSIHAVLSITPSPSEGIEDGPRLRDCQPSYGASRALHRQPQDDVAVALAETAHGLRRSRTASLLLGFDARLRLGVVVNTMETAQRRLPITVACAA